jgi:predicted SprT family Zn-dependent metalloprotease
VPALPAFALQKAISTTIRDHARDYWTGTVYTTNRRVWEHDEDFKKYLQKIRAMCSRHGNRHDFHDRRFTTRFRPGPCCSFRISR